MYAIIADGGKQYKVEPGQSLYVERRDLPEGATTVEFDQVLLVGEGATTRIGTPIVSGAKVMARLDDDEVKGPKEIIVKYRRRKGYRLKKGHRQKYLKVTVESING